MLYKNKIETIRKIHLLNLLSKNNFEGEQKPSQKNIVMTFFILHFKIQEFTW
jgi:hypothetical protein